jgi:hypothetical protein
VDVAPLVPGLEEDTGALTAQDVQDLERGRGGDNRTTGQSDNQTGQQAILTNVPDAVTQPDNGPAQTITGSNVQTGTEMPVPPPTADAGAGAGATVPDAQGVGQELSDASQVSPSPSLPVSESPAPLMLPSRNFTGGLAQQLEGSAATLGRNAARGTRNPEPITNNSSLSSAYTQASRGSSSAMVPISRVYEQAKAQNPALTVPQFLAEVQAADQRGEVLLEPFDSPAGLQAAGEFVVRNASGVPSVNMAVPSPQVVSNPSRAEGGTLASPAELKAAQKSNEAKLSALGLPVKPGTRIWAAAKMRTALGKIAKDGSYPATMRAMADLLTRVNLDNLLLKVEADARLNFAGKYQPYNDGRGEISLNTRVTGRGDTDIVQSLVHELLHHATYRALRSPKNAVQKGAIADLEALRKRALAALSAQEQGRQFDYELSNTDEFIAALFTRADFQTALAGIPAESAPKSLTQRIRSVLDEIFRVLGELVTGKKVEPGSVLEASFSATLRLMENGRLSVQARIGNAVMTQGPGPVTIRAAALRAVKAYHGTPHKVDKFSTSKIGTGEGAQAYGWGLYFAQGKSVAESYQRSTSQPEVTINGKRFKRDSSGVFRDESGKTAGTLPKHLEAAMYGVASSKPLQDVKILAEEAESFLQTRIGYSKETISKAKKAIEQGDVRLEDRGNLYTVELLPDEDEFLDWDKPLAEQSEKVKAALPEIGNQSRGSRYNWNPSLPMSEAYRQIAGDFGDDNNGNGDVLASKALAAAGIPGIRYADGQSRVSRLEIRARQQEVNARKADVARDPSDTNQRQLVSAENALADLLKKDREGTRNFVVFDEKHIRITEENGQPVEGWQTAADGGMTNGEGRMTNEAALLNPAAPTPNETRSRFASPNAADRVINGPRTDAQVADEARAWLGSVDQQTAIEAFASQAVPLLLDAQEHAAAVLINDLSEQAAKSGTEVQRMWAHVQGQRMARIWTKEFLSADPARALRQRGVVNNTILQPIAPILAAQETLIDRAEAVGKTRFDGGWEGLVQKINDLLKRIENLVSGTAAEKIAKGDSTPSLKTLLNNLRRKMYPGMDWTEIFTDLPSTQKQRQLAIYERLMKDERLQGLTPQERLDLTNELDKAWQRERREVFKRELRKAGILGEKDAGDRLKVTNAMPKLLRLVNLGMFNSAMFREVIAPQYGLKVIDSTTAARLRGMAEAAYAQPEGVLRNRKLGELLNAMQSATGSTLAELVNSYWTAAVLSGTRTQWDTWMAFTNGMGTNLLQAAGLLARGRGKDAVAAHAAWWRGLLDGMRESLQILAKGDYSVLKRFGTDLNKALQGESGFRPVPLGESLWQNGNTWQKYFMAPVMIWTGRLMAAADHVNNTATTAGAMAVARALHPEFYGRTTFSATDRANARAQALREVTGGAEPVTAEDKATVSVRVRELLYGAMREPERLEANEIGDMAAFQNDPTGIFGTIYAAMKAGLGTVQRGMEAKAQDMQANQWTRAAAGLMAGSLHGLTGTRFMRFGFNFGAELTRYVPGTALLDKLSSRSVYGKDTGPMQRELLLGKNVIGLMLGSTLAALFLNSDDDDDGWQIEGDWSGLTPQQVKERMSAGLERMTMWKRDGDTVRRVSYKQWPTMGLFAVVGGMLDEKRHKPAQWAQHGTAGHLGRALGTGMLQIKNVSAMRNLVELFGGTRFAGDPSTGIIDDVVKTATNFAGGFVPTALKDAEIWQDPRNFKAEGWLEELQRSTPIARRFVNDGRPQLNLLGEEVKLQRAPWSRTITSVESSEASRVLGALLGRGLNLPQPSDAVLVVQNGVKVPLETLGREKVWQYEKAVGTAYKQWLATEGSALLQMPVKQAAKVIEQRAASIKRQALARVVR